MSVWVAGLGSLGLRDLALFTIEQRHGIVQHAAISPVGNVSLQALFVPPKAYRRTPAFDVKLFLDSAGLGRRVDKFRAKETIFSQGDPAKNVLYIQEGGVKLTVVNKTGKEAVVALLGPGDFVGEACLAGQSICIGDCNCHYTHRCARH